MRALDGAGAPVQDAVVLVRLPERELPYPDERVLRTGADGAARLDDVPAGRAFVRLLRGGARDADVVGGETATVDLRLRAGIRVLGLVVDEGGRPVPDASVWLSERWTSAHGGVVAVTDVEGRFTLEGLDRDQVLAARCAGFAPAPLARVRGGPGDEVAVRLRLGSRGGMLAGRVVDASGAAVADAWLQAGVEVPEEGTPARDGVPVFGAPPQRCRTDAAGRFLLAGVALGDVPVAIRAAGYAPYFARLASVEQPGEGHWIVLRPELAVEGVVRDADGGPVPEALVRAVPAGAVGAGVPDFGASEARSAADGSFVLRGLDEGPVALSAEHALHRRADAELRLAVGQPARWNPVLARAPRIFGTVLDDAGRPDAGWVVVATSERVPRVRVAAEPTGDDGVFSIGDLPERAFDLTVQRPGGWREFPAAIARGVRPGYEPFVLRLADRAASTATVVGRLVGPQGAPVRAASVDVWHREQALWRTQSVDPATGEFAFADVPAGTCDFAVRASEHPARELEAVPVEAGALVELGDVRLEPAAFVTGVVHGPEELLDGLRVTIAAEAGPAQTDVPLEVGGVFRSGPLPAGRFTVLAAGSAAVAAPVACDAVAGEEVRVELVLVRATARLVTFGKPPRARDPRTIAVRVLDGGGRSVWARGAIPAVDGRLSARIALPPGLYRLEAETNNELRAEAPLAFTGSAADAEPLVLPLGR